MEIVYDANDVEVIWFLGIEKYRNTQQNPPKWASARLYTSTSGQTYVGFFPPTCFRKAVMEGREGEFPLFSSLEI